MGRCILVSAGEFNFTKEEFVKKSRLTDDDVLVAVDGGLNYCNNMGIMPSIIIGDMDSADSQSADILEQLKQKDPDRVIKLPTQKDDTDTLAAVKWGLSQGYKDFEIYGATGGRIDHYIANIQVLLYIKHAGANGRIIDKGLECFVLENESIQLEDSQFKTVSILSLSKKSGGVSISGMKYNVTDMEIRNDFPIGVSNEFSDTNATISVADGQLAVIVTY